MIALQSRQGPIVAKETPREAPSPGASPAGSFVRQRRQRRRQAQAALLIVGFVAASLIAWAFAELFVAKLKIAFAEEQTAIFEQMAEDAELGSVATGVSALEYVLAYYPSGTKQATGSRLDRIVERSRDDAVRRILAALRKKTGEDYGDDPKAWIRALSTRPIR